MTHTWYTCLSHEHYKYYAYGFSLLDTCTTHMALAVCCSVLQSIFPLSTNSIHVPHMAHMSKSRTLWITMRTNSLHSIHASHIWPLQCVAGCCSPFIPMPQTLYMTHTCLSHERYGLLCIRILFTVYMAFAVCCSLLQSAYSPVTNSIHDSHMARISESQTRWNTIGTNSLHFLRASHICWGKGAGDNLGQEYMYVWMIWIHEHLYTYLQISTYIYIHIRIYIHITYVCVCILNMCTQRSSQNLSDNILFGAISALVYIYEYICIYMYIYIYIYAYI